MIRLFGSTSFPTGLLENMLLSLSQRHPFFLLPPALLDCKPNFLKEEARYAEFARAALKTLLDTAATGHKMEYVGLIREEKLPDIRSALESQVYDSWETCWHFCSCFFYAD